MPPSEAIQERFYRAVDEMGMAGNELVVLRPELATA